MTELEKIEYAKLFIDKLANGIDPLYDTPLKETDCANQVRMSRCFFYVSDILRRVIENGGIYPAPMSKKTKRQRFSLTMQERQNVSVSETPLSVKEISTYLNGLINTQTTKKISSVKINAWLLHNGFLKIVKLPDGKSAKRPTESGYELGILTEKRMGAYGEYTVVLYNQSAQAFLFDHIEAIASFRHEKPDPLEEFHSRPWTPAQDQHLTMLIQNGVPIKDVAFDMKRTESGVRTRLEYLGFYEKTFYVESEDVDFREECEE